MKNNAAILLALIVGALVFFPDRAQAMAKRPRGIRNNNPMNLRFVGSINWDGQTGSDDAGYAVFISSLYGIRAGVKNLINGYFGRGINTIASITRRYAPDHENPTDDYISFLSARLGVGPDTELQPTATTLFALAKAIIQFENGEQPYRDAVIRKAITMATE